jgi:hypothetical protein
MWHVWFAGKLYTESLFVNLREIGHLEDLELDGRTILEIVKRNLIWSSTGLIFFRFQRVGGLF